MNVRWIGRSGCGIQYKFVCFFVGSRELFFTSLPTLGLYFYGDAVKSSIPKSILCSNEWIPTVKWLHRTPKHRRMQIEEGGITHGLSQRTFYIKSK